jgi:hypothetical protein
LLEGVWALDPKPGCGDRHCRASRREVRQGGRHGALDQLEWCINYLHWVRKPDIARAMARNRKQILKRIR